MHSIGTSCREPVVYQVRARVREGVLLLVSSVPTGQADEWAQTSGVKAAADFGGEPVCACARH